VTELQNVSFVNETWIVNETYVNASDPNATQMILVNKTFYEMRNVSIVKTITAEKGGDKIIFNERSAPGKPFYLCYQFAGEPFKLYKNFPLSASDVVNISVNVGDIDAAVVDYQEHGLSWNKHTKWRFFEICYIRCIRQYVMRYS
jgi:hypothetical protein